MQTGELETGDALNNYLVERKKAGQSGYYAIGIVHARNMRDAMIKARADFNGDDFARVSLLSVTHTFALKDVRW